MRGKKEPALSSSITEGGGGVAHRGILEQEPEDRKRSCQPRRKSWKALRRSVSACTDQPSCFLRSSCQRGLAEFRSLGRMLWRLRCRELIPALLLGACLSFCSDEYPAQGPPASPAGLDMLLSGRPRV